MLKRVNRIFGHIVPDVAHIAREMTEKSQITIIVDIVRLLPLWKLLFLGIRNLPNLFFLLKKDYASGVILLAELEYLKNERSGKKIDELILHSQMTDMAILLGNRKVFTGFLSLCRWYGVRPAIFSNNPLYCIQMLSSLKSAPKNLILYIADDRNKAIEEYAMKSMLDIRLVIANEVKQSNTQ